MVRLSIMFLMLLHGSLTTGQSSCRSLIRDCHQAAGQVSPNDVFNNEFVNLPPEEQEKKWSDMCSSLKNIDTCLDAIEPACRGDVELQKYFESHLCTQTYQGYASVFACTGAVTEASSTGQFPCWVNLERPSDSSTPANFDYCRYYTELGNCRNMTISEVCEQPLVTTVAHVGAVMDLIKLKAEIGEGADCPLITNHQIDSTQSCGDVIQSCYGNQNVREVLEAADQTAAWGAFCRVVEAGAGCVAAITGDCGPLATRVRHTYDTLCASSDEDLSQLDACLSDGVDDTQRLVNCQYDGGLFDVWQRNKGPEYCLSYTRLFCCYNASFHEICPTSRVADLAGAFSTTAHLVTLWDYLKVCPMDTEYSEVCNSAFALGGTSVIGTLSIAISAIFASIRTSRIR